MHLGVFAAIVYVALRFVCGEDQLILWPNFISAGWKNGTDVFLWSRIHLPVHPQNRTANTTSCDDAHKHRDLNLPGPGRVRRLVGARDLALLVPCFCEPLPTCITPGISIFLEKQTRFKRISTFGDGCLDTHGTKSHANPGGAETYTICCCPPSFALNLETCHGIRSCFTPTNPPADRAFGAGSFSLTTCDLPTTFCHVFSFLSVWCPVFGSFDVLWLPCVHLHNDRLGSAFRGRGFLLFSVGGDQLLPFDCSSMMYIQPSAGTFNVTDSRHYTREGGLWAERGHYLKVVYLRCCSAPWQTL